MLSRTICVLVALCLCACGGGDDAGEKGASAKTGAENQTAGSQAGGNTSGGAAGLLDKKVLKKAPDSEKKGNNRIVHMNEALGPVDVWARRGKYAPELLAEKIGYGQVSKTFRTPPQGISVAIVKTGRAPTEKRSVVLKVRGI